MSETTKQATNQYAGIDYGLGTANVDNATGIRYGVISQSTVGGAWYDSAEPEYGKPHCPKCGDEIKASDDPALFAAHEDLNAAEDNPDWFDGKDYCCVDCQTCYWSDSVFPDEALGYSFKDAEYTLTDCLDTDIFVLSSPYFTYAQFCSPCVPGAGNLDTPMDGEQGAKCYALGHDWFWDTELKCAPYRVFKVADGSEVLPETGEEN